MKNRIWMVLGTLALCCVLLLGSIKSSWATQKIADFKTRLPIETLLAQVRWYTPPGVPVEGCSLRPKFNPPPINIEITFVPGQLTLDRFRKSSDPNSIASLPDRLTQPLTQPTPNYTPREEIALANPTNFGERYRLDVYGRPAVNDPIIVLHETVIPAWQTVKIFQTPHPSSGQASYHALIKQDGTIFYLVPPDKRAFGAGDSSFGSEAVTTNRQFPSAVNNFAYHISFESPPDGRGNGNVHSGYTDYQYWSAAWLAAKTGVPDNRITTHKAVDRSGSRKDPRSFDSSKFFQILNQFPKTQEVVIGCPVVSTEKPV
ncbi:MAG: peptidoglycan recognition family protein [Thermosynechococcaceae cyanobacterium]